jgi:ectoine hydroxylase-related dioxygenase (phytanoyl-CoA dioxygenase family)
VNDIERPFQATHVNGRRGYIKMGNQRFLSNTLSWGRKILDIYTNPFIVDLCEAYSQSEVHLSNYRIYQTLPSKNFKMWWHVDNKTDVFDYEKEIFIPEIIPADKGLIIIMYLVDVKEGGVQLVKGSHKWSRKHEGKESFDDLEENFGKDIVTFNNKPKGTLIAYDYATIHRAEPYQGGDTRMSLFGQYSPSWMPTGEPIILHSRDLAGLTEKQMQVLSFGRNSTTENWPISQPVEALQKHDVDNILNSIPKRKLIKQLFRKTK